MTSDSRPADEVNRAERPRSEDEILRSALLRLDAKILGLVLGIIFGLVVFVMTNWVALGGGHVDEHGRHIIGPNLAILGQFFLGYRVTFFGSLIGFAYAFALGTLTGAAIGVLYNKLSSFRKPPD